VEISAWRTRGKKSPCTRTRSRPVVFREKSPPCRSASVGGHQTSRRNCCPRVYRIRPSPLPHSRGVLSAVWIPADQGRVRKWVGAESIETRRVRQLFLFQLGECTPGSGWGDSCFEDGASLAVFHCWSILRGRRSICARAMSGRHRQRNDHYNLQAGTQKRYGATVRYCFIPEV